MTADTGFPKKIELHNFEVDIKYQGSLISSTQVKAKDKEDAKKRAKELFTLSFDIKKK